MRNKLASGFIVKSRVFAHFDLGGRVLIILASDTHTGTGTGAMLASSLTGPGGGGGPGPGAVCTSSIC